MDGLLLNPTSKKQLEGFIEQPVHTVALIGKEGAGKGLVAAHLAAELLSLSIDKLGSYSYFRVYKPENNTISIETAREITNLIKLKTTGTRAIRRIIIIEDAQTMTIEAQNALLKTFEEPPVDTVFILTVTHTSQILPTILSRVQTIPLQPIEQSEVIQYFTAAGHDQTKIKQYYFMSGGLVGLMDALFSDQITHPLAQSIQQAKTILRTDSFGRLTMVDEIIKHKQAQSIVEALCTISRSALYIEASQENTKETALKRWSLVLQKAEEAKRLLGQNAQPKLVLTSLFLEI